MFVGTPLGRVIALDPASGRERWVFDPKIARDVTYGDFASRGVSTWLDAAAAADALCRRRIFVATAQSQLFAIDARDGRPCAMFGRGGSVNLKELGAHTIKVRAKNTRGDTQPMEPLWNPPGYMRNVVERVVVTAV